MKFHVDGSDLPPVGIRPERAPVHASWSFIRASAGCLEVAPARRPLYDAPDAVDIHDTLASPGVATKTPGLGCRSAGSGSSAGERPRATCCAIGRQNTSLCAVRKLSRPAVIRPEISIPLILPATCGQRLIFGKGLRRKSSGAYPLMHPDLETRHDLLSIAAAHRILELNRTNSYC